MENLTRETFKEKIFNYEVNNEWKFKGDKPAIIDFYADWCGPCKIVSPILEELAKDYDSEINIYKVDTTKEQELAALFQIQSIPSLLFIPKNGKPKMTAGALPKQNLEKIINEELLGT